MGIRILAAPGASFWSGNAALISTNADVIRVNADGAAAARVDVGLVGPASEAGATFGADVNLYRLGANVLASDDSIVTTTSTSFVVAGNGTASHVKIGPAGPGSLPGAVFGVAEDTNLYRSAANYVSTDDKLGAALNIAARDGTANKVEIGLISGASALTFLNGTVILYGIDAATWGTDDSFKLAAAASRLIFGNAAQSQATVGAAGAAAVLPLAPLGYFKVIDPTGAEVVIPYYTAV